jgi:hypothetical protein
MRSKRKEQQRKRAQHQPENAEADEEGGKKERRFSVFPKDKLAGIGGIVINGDRVAHLEAPVRITARALPLVIPAEGGILDDRIPVISIAFCCVDLPEAHPGNAPAGDAVTARIPRKVTLPNKKADDQTSQTEAKRKNGEHGKMRHKTPPGRQAAFSIAGKAVRRKRGF